MSRVSLTGACARRRLMESASRRGGGKEHERSEISGMRSREADGQDGRVAASYEPGKSDTSLGEARHVDQSG